MAANPDDDVDDGPFTRPLPQDDRIWRHPSELDHAGSPRSWLTSFLRRSRTGAVRELRKKG